MSKELSVLEKNVLKAKGLGEPELEQLLAAGITSRDDFKTVGDAATLMQLIPGLSGAVAEAIMAWAVGSAAALGGAGIGAGLRNVVVDSSEVVYCVHCNTRQPKDYSSGDLCTACGKQAEPILACFWCSATGPGRFCRNCGAEFVPTAELDLAMLLRREGLPKEAVPARLAQMTPAEKEVLWGRVRKLRR